MRFIMPLLVCALAGCATQPKAARKQPAAPVSTAAALGINLHPQVVTVESRYELAGYYDPADPGVWHSAHAVFRATEVSRQQAQAVPPSEVGALTSYTPTTFAPLPPSAELAAELTEQKHITAELRALKQQMVAVENQAQDQFGQLVANREATDALRRKLEGEWAQIKAREAVGAKPAAPLADASQSTTPADKW